MRQFSVGIKTITGRHGFYRETVFLLSPNPFLDPKGAASLDVIVIGGGPAGRTALLKGMAPTTAKPVIPRLTLLVSG